MTTRTPHDCATGPWKHPANRNRKPHTPLNDRLAHVALWLAAFIAAGICLALISGGF